MSPDPRTHRFTAIFEAFEAVGFNVVPAHPHKKHPAGPWKGLAEPTSRRVTREDIEAGLWVLDAFPDLELEAFLFPSSHPRTPLVVVDVDNMDWYDRAIEDFGETPIKVQTRRGVHLYYEADPARKVTSHTWIYGERTVDVKAWGAGVMAPGSRRSDGGLYVPNIPVKQWGAYLG